MIYFKPRRTTKEDAKLEKNRNNLDPKSDTIWLKNTEEGIQIHSQKVQINSKSFHFQPAQVFTKTV